MHLLKEIRDIERFDKILLVLFEEGLSYYLKRPNFHKRLSAYHRIKSSLRHRSGSLPSKIRRAMERLGPTFVKFGQILSTRPDLVPLDWCEEFSKLQDSVPSFPYRDVKKIVEQELDKPIDKVFKRFSKKPIASASIGQVHTAFFKGKKVAVKVQRPDIKDTMDTDLEIMQFLAKEIVRHFPESEDYDPVGVVQEFCDWTKKELDYTNEASNIQLFADNFKNDKRIKVPKVFWDVTTSKVLTLEFIDGVEVSALSSKQKNKHGKSLAKLAVDSYVKQIFVHGFFHGDPHPANLLVLNSKRIAYIDFGIMGRFTSKIKKSVVDMFIGLVNNDPDPIVDAFLSFDPDVSVSRDALSKDISDFLVRWNALSKTKHYSSSGSMLNLVHIAIEHKIPVPADLVILAKAFLTCDTVARMLDPDVDFMAGFKPYVKELVAEQYLPKNIEKEVQKSFLDIRKDLFQLPKAINKFLGFVQKGRFTVDINPQELSSHEEQSRRNNRMIAFGIVIAGLLLAGALALDHPRSFFDLPPVPTFCFSLAAILFVWLLFYSKKTS